MKLLSGRLGPTEIPIKTLNVTLATPVCKVRRNKLGSTVDLQDCPKDCSRFPGEGIEDLDSFLGVALNFTSALLTEDPSTRREDANSWPLRALNGLSLRTLVVCWWNQTFKEGLETELPVTSSNTHSQSKSVGTWSFWVEQMEGIGGPVYTSRESRVPNASTINRADRPRFKSRVL